MGGSPRMATSCPKCGTWVTCDQIKDAQDQEWRDDDRYELQRKSVQSAVNTARRALRDDYGQMPGHSISEIQTGCLADVIFGAEHWLASFPPQAEGEG